MNVSHAGHGHFAPPPKKTDEAKKPLSSEVDTKVAAPKKSPPPDSGRTVDTNA